MNVYHLTSIARKFSCMTKTCSCNCLSYSAGLIYKKHGTCIHLYREYFLLNADIFTEKIVLSLEC